MRFSDRRRIVIAIADRMPEIGKTSYETGPAYGITRFAAYLEAKVRACTLAIEDCRHGKIFRYAFRI